MKKFIVLSAFLLSCHTSVFAMEPEVEPAISAPCTRQNINQEKINEIVSETAQYVYGHINENWTYGDTGKTPWYRYWIGSYWGSSGPWECGFIDPLGSPIVTPIYVEGPKGFTNIVQDLEDLIKKPAALECHAALKTAQVFCLKNILGGELFTQYAEDLYKEIVEYEKMDIGLTATSFFCNLPAQFMTIVKDKEAVPGSTCCITNVLCYNDYKRGENDPRLNAFCVGDDQYVTFIPGTAVVSSEDIVDHLRDSFFRPVSGVYHYEHEARCDAFNADEGSFERLRSEEQKMHYNYHYILDAKKINDYIKTGKIDLGF